MHGASLTSASPAGPAYLVPLEEISRRSAEAWDRGATEVCMQGGIHPDFNGDTYLRILAAAKAGAPDIHVHAFSPLEVRALGPFNGWFGMGPTPVFCQQVLQGAATLGLSLPAYLQRLRDAGLGSLPGTAAEVLDEAVRAVLCPDKLSTTQWLEVVAAAHATGLRTTSTVMFGHCDDYSSWGRHLVALRHDPGCFLLASNRRC